MFSARARSWRCRDSPWLAGIVLFLVAGSPALADWTQADVLVAARALSFVAEPLSGTVRVGIVYAPDSPSSVRQAQGLRSILADGLRIGALELRPVLIDSARVANPDVDLFFLTQFTPTDGTPILLSDTKTRPILCVTTDIAQVRSGNCVMGVQSRPKVEVFVNRAAASANGIIFSTVFRVMITEL